MKKAGWQGLAPQQGQSTTVSTGTLMLECHNHTHERIP